MKKIIYLYLLCSCFACGQEKGTALSISDTPFFDLEVFMNKEIQKLSKKNKAATKTIILNGEKEIKENLAIDFAKELEIFSQSNINKIAWLELYEVDSVFNENNRLSELHYQTNSHKLKTKSLSILYDKSEITQIKVLNRSQTALADSEQHLLYTVDKGYEIENLQEVSLTDPQKLFVEVVF